MKDTITYNEARAIWNEYTKTDYLKLHSLETEAIMRKLATHFGEDPEYWGITGLLHDLDMDLIGDDYAKHGHKTVEILRSKGYDLPQMFEAIVAHTEGVEESSAERKTHFDYALAAAESVTGIISAYVAIRPDKTIAGTKPKSIRKKLKSKAFAAAVNREFIYDIEKTGLELTVFLQLAIDAFTEIADETGM